MRNPLLFSSEPLVKRALEDYNAPYKDMLNSKNVAGVQDFWKNLQSYPQDVQKKIYEQMGQIEVPGNTYGGFDNMLSHGLSQAYHTVGDTLGDWGNSIAQVWGGGRTDLAPGLSGNDIIAEKRDEAKRVYDLAMQDPQYMARLQAVLPQYEQTVKNEASQLRANQANPPAPAPANNTYSGSANPAIGSGGPGMFNTSNIKQTPAAAPPAAVPKAPAPAPVTATSTPAPTQTQTPAQAPTPPAPVPAQAAAPAQPVAPAPTATQAAAPAPVAAQPAPPAPVQQPAAPSLVSAPAGRQGMRAQRQQLRQEMRDFRQQRRQDLGLGQNNQQMGAAIQPGLRPNAQPAPRKEGLIDGIPASQWIAQNKARQQQTMPAASAKPSGMIYDSVSGQMVPQGFNRYNPGAASQARPQPQKAVAAPAPTPQPATSNYDPNYRPNLRGIKTFKPSPEQMRRGILG